MNEQHGTPANAQELDTASLDLVVGGIVVHQVNASELDARKQEQSEKFTSEEYSKLK